jgi:IstB-like ATP binding protein
MPVAHQQHAEWTPERILGWAASVGVNTRLFAERLLAERIHPEHGHRSGVVVFRLSQKYGSDRLDPACPRALSVGALSYRHVTMAAAWDEQQRHPDVQSMTFDECFALLVEAEWVARETKRVGRALKQAKLPAQSSVHRGRRM